MRSILCIVAILLCTKSFGQVKIGDNPSVLNASALLELESSDKGLLLPRLSAVQIAAISNPATGLLVFNTTESSLTVRLDTGWMKVDNPTGINNLWSNAGQNIYNFNTGNVGVGTNTPSEKLHVAGNLRVDSNLYIPATTATAGVIYQNGHPIFHTSGNQFQQNVFLGLDAGSFSPYSKKGVAIGHGALSNSDGSGNIAIGFYAAHALSGGSTYVDCIKNIFLGYSSGETASGGINNIAIGNEAGFQLAKNSTSNVLIGAQCGRNLTSGIGNCLIGYNVQTTTGIYNTGMGSTSGINFATGNYNTWLGGDAFQSNRNGSYNTMLGFQAGKSDSVGSFNVFIGAYAGAYTQGHNNVFIGHTAGFRDTGYTVVSKLIINNNDNLTHLIDGDFNTGKVGIKKTLATLNYTLDVGGEIRVGSMADNPSGSNGVFYYNTTLNRFRGYENGQWKDLSTNSMKSKAGDPTTGDISSGAYDVYKNTTNGNVYLWVNDGGVLKKVQLQ